LVDDAVSHYLRGLTNDISREDEINLVVKIIDINEVN
jgi:hypothetical protein